MKLRCPNAGPRLCLRSDVYVRSLLSAPAPRPARGLGRLGGPSGPMRPSCQGGDVWGGRVRGGAFWVRDATNGARTVLTNCGLRQSFRLQCITLIQFDRVYVGILLRIAYMCVSLAFGCEIA